MLFSPICSAMARAVFVSFLANDALVYDARVFDEWVTNPEGEGTSVVKGTTEFAPRTSRSRACARSACAQCMRAVEPIFSWPCGYCVQVRNYGASCAAQSIASIAGPSRRVRRSSAPETIPRSKW